MRHPHKWCKKLTTIDCPGSLNGLALFQQAFPFMPKGRNGREVDFPQQAKISRQEAQYTSLQQKQKHVEGKQNLKHRGWKAQHHDETLVSLTQCPASDGGR